jgi:hypothetical protein
MADNLQFVRDLFRQASVDLSRDDVWDVQGTPVVKHRALERLGAAIGIEFAAAQILRCEADEAVILATGKKGDKAEWSIGEARTVLMHDTGRKNQKGKPIYEAAVGSIGNYQITPRQAAYPYAMAEKRAKDRVILKLAGLHGVYSEEEADEFTAKRGGDGPTMTELLTTAEASIDAAAKEGLTSLQSTWERLDQDLKPPLKAKVIKLVTDLKQKAMEAA